MSTRRLGAIELSSGIWKLFQDTISGQRDKMGKRMRHSGGYDTAELRVSIIIDVSLSISLCNYNTLRYVSQVTYISHYDAFLL